MNLSTDIYLNPYYITTRVSDPKTLYANAQIKNLRFWEEHFLYFSITSKPYYNLSEEIYFHR